MVQVHALSRWPLYLRCGPRLALVGLVQTFEVLLCWKKTVDGQSVIEQRWRTWNDVMVGVRRYLVHLRTCPSPHVSQPHWGAG